MGNISFYDEQAKERQAAAGGDRKSEKAHSKSVVEKLPQPIAGKSRDLAGKAVGVSGKMVDFATTVLKKGAPGQCPIAQPNSVGGRVL